VPPQCPTGYRENGFFFLQLGITVHFFHILGKESPICPDFPLEYSDIAVKSPLGLWRKF